MNEKYNYKFTNFCIDNKVDLDFLDQYLEYAYKNRKWIFMDENSEFPAVKLKLNLFKNYDNYTKEKDAYDYLENHFLLKHNLLKNYDDDKIDDDILKIIEKDLFKFSDWCKEKRSERFLSKIFFGIISTYFVYNILLNDHEFLFAFVFTGVYIVLLFSFEIVEYITKVIIKIKTKNIAKKIDKLKLSGDFPAIERQRMFEEKIEKDKYARSLNGEVEYSKNGNLIILGEELDEKDFPNLCKWAKTNPDTLIEQIKSIAQKWHEGSYSSAIIALEVDLSHQ